MKKDYEYEYIVLRLELDWSELTCNLREAVHFQCGVVGGDGLSHVHGSIVL